MNKTEFINFITIMELTYSERSLKNDIYGNSAIMFSGTKFGRGEAIFDLNENFVRIDFRLCRLFLSSILRFTFNA